MQTLNNNKYPNVIIMQQPAVQGGTLAYSEELQREKELMQEHLIDYANAMQGMQNTIEKLQADNQMLAEKLNEIVTQQFVNKQQNRAKISNLEQTVANFKQSNEQLVQTLIATQKAHTEQLYALLKPKGWLARLFGKNRYAKTQQIATVDTTQLQPSNV
ncbi:MAG: hypothetical protein FWF56_03460 [Firmicutes bacterium]|nr:hypothetical protein [Bacillota bacterium]